ncbi:hypothetical protein ACIU1J_31660 [Azospirillum doebereinerae]|uniref:hypothetical protein n=1 Tax=Azospirillum doebereinerae TaxID=92933 RepID=UPI00384B5661
MPNILRLLLLLLTPLWLSLAAQGLGLRWSLPAVLSDWLQLEKTVDPASLPPPGWRESGYLAANPDVAAAVRDGRMSSGYAHYLQSGRAENRPGGFRTAPVPAPPSVPASAPAPAPIPEPPPRTAAIAEPAPAVPAPPPKPRPEPQPDPAPHSEPSRPASPPAPAPEMRASPKPATGVQVARIRTGNSDGAVRVVLDLDRAPRFEPPSRRPDGSLAVTLPGTDWRAAPPAGFPPRSSLTGSRTPAHPAVSSSRDRPPSRRRASPPCRRTASGGTGWSSTSPRPSPSRASPPGHDERRRREDPAPSSRHAWWWARPRRQAGRSARRCPLSPPSAATRVPSDAEAAL